MRHSGLLSINLKRFFTFDLPTFFGILGRFYFQNFQLKRQSALYSKASFRIIAFANRAKSTTATLFPLKGSHHISLELLSKLLARFDGIALEYGPNIILRATITNQKNVTRITYG